MNADSHLILIELDEEFCDHLKKYFAKDSRVTVLHTDALHLPETFPLATIAPWRKHKPVITAGLFAAVLVITILGVALMGLGRALEDRFTVWRGTGR